MTSTRNGEHDLRRMPCTNTTNLAETLVSLARKLLGSPTVGDTLETVALGDGNNIDVLVLLEDGRDADGLLEETLSELDLVGNRSTVDLDLHEVRLLLLQASLPDLGVGEDTDDSAVLADTLEFTGNGLAAILSMLLRVASESLLLRPVPVLVEATLDFIRQMRSPDSGECAQATGSLDISNNTDDDHGRGLDHGNSLDNLALVHL